MSTQNENRSLSFLISIAIGFLGVLLLATAFFGIQQLRELASPEATVSMDDLPVLKPVWALYQDPTGPINAARIASNVQFTFFAIGGLGVILLIGTITHSVAGLRKR